MSDEEEAAEDREEIVSSLVSLSETLCEKAMQLSEGTTPKG